ncbi:MAG: hypothetical protein ACFFDQ_10865 [Candidatus Thorarchaeota archaeon]
MTLFEEVGLERDIFLILSSGIFFYAILFSAIFFGRWYKDTYRKSLDLRLAWSVFFLGLSINAISFIISDFWLTTEPLNTTFVSLGYIALMLAITAFFAAMEMILPYKTRHLLTSISIISTFMPLIIPRFLFEPLALFEAILALIGITLFLRYTWKSTAGAVRKNVQWVVGGFVIGWIGFIGRSDTGYLLGAHIYTLGILFLTFGILIFGYVLSTSPALDELDWQQQILELYVIQTGGLLMCHHQFVENPNIDQALTAAGIAGIQSLFQEITRSDTGLNIVSIGVYDILFAHGASFTSVLIAKKPYRILLDKVQEFTDRFQYEFGTVLQQFEGSLHDFHTADELIESIF